jgi:hypothetical protein
MNEYFTPRAFLLKEAMEIVHKDRNANYGSPEDNFAAIANIWTAYFKVAVHNRVWATENCPQFTPADVAVLMVLVKIVRLANNPNHHDSVVDIAGYAACLADIQESAKAVGSASA